ncbi:unnamed protein product, partial [Prorocentrum cordatum]
VHELMDVGLDTELQKQFGEDHEFVLWVAAVRQIDTISQDELEEVIHRAETFKCRAIGLAMARVATGLNYVLSRTANDDLGPVSMSRLDFVIRAMNAKKAKGVDNTGPVEVQRLLGAAKFELLDLMVGIERRGMWPEQPFMAVSAPLFIRPLMDETCKEMQISTATISLDLEQFYDGISIALMCAAGIMQGFPAIILALELQLPLAP